jgi:DNA-binding transcriptional ArsR family regulator
MAPEPAPAREIRLDARNLRGIAHPVRVRMLGLLRSSGPATATGLARLLGLNTGATSYHLRQLAEHGFIVEETGRGVGRERWWRAAHDNTAFPATELLSGDTGEGAIFLRSVGQVAADNILRAVDARPTLPPEWQDAEDFSDYLLTLTAQETRVLVSELHALLKKHRREHAGRSERADRSRVAVQLQVFPLPDTADAAPADADQEAPR